MMLYECYGLKLPASLMFVLQIIQTNKNVLQLGITDPLLRRIHQGLLDSFI